MISEAVTESSTCPKASAPSAAASVSGTAWVRSVPTNCFAPIVGIQEQQQHDHQRARADRGHADDDPADHSDRDRRQPPDGESWTDRRRGLARAAIEHEAQDHRGGADKQRDAERHSIVCSADDRMPIRWRM